MLTVRVKINIASQTTPQIIPVVQGDTGRSILFEIADFVIPAQTTATYFIKKPSGHAVYNSATIDRNTVLANLTAQSIAEVGENPGQVRIIKNDEVVTSFDFILDVEPFRGIDAIESTTEMNIFDQAVQQALEEIDGSLDSIVADEFSTSDSYLDGEYVLKDGVLYRFTADHAAGAWSTSDTEAITVGEALEELAGGGGGGAVQSVNGKTGTVVLDAGDLEYDDEETYSAGSVGAELTSLKGGLNDKLDAPETAGTSGQVLTSDGEGGQYWHTPSGGGGGSVDSVNGKTGVVVLDASDVGAASSEDLDSIGTWSPGKNKYDKDACSPSDKHGYSSSGDYFESDYYATTGKIPVEASTQYAISAGSAAVKTVRYYSGSEGSTFISGADVWDNTFTTPSGCTYIAINLFGAIHTTSDYENAIAVTQLEIGSAPTTFEPYKEILTINLDNVEDGDTLSGIADAFYLTPGKNKYNKDACNPADKYVYSSSGDYSVSDYYATTGKIPVEASTTYVFSAGNAAVKTVRYYSGANGATYISGEDVNGAFTTPQNCTFIAINLFGATHTTTQYNDAIASAQLEKGVNVTAYEQYAEHAEIYSDRVENGEVLAEMNNILVKQSQVNLYDKTLAENNKYVSGDTVGTSNTYAYTGAIPVKPSTQYNLSKSEDAPMTISTTINEYNAVGAFLRTKSPTRTQHSNIPFVTDADTIISKLIL